MTYKRPIITKKRNSGIYGFSQTKPTAQVKVVGTGRELEHISDTVRRGYKALFKQIVRDDKIYNIYHLAQDIISGEVFNAADIVNWDSKYKSLVGKYYPVSFSMPFAAYLIPPDLNIGERVWLEDIIEDIPEYAGVFRQKRLDAAIAIWNGHNFDIQYQAKSARSWIG